MRVVLCTVVCIHMHLCASKRSMRSMATYYVVHAYTGVPLYALAVCSMPIVPARWGLLKSNVEVPALLLCEFARGDCLGLECALQPAQAVTISVESPGDERRLNKGNAGAHSPRRLVKAAAVHESGPGRTLFIRLYALRTALIQTASLARYGL